MSFLYIKDDRPEIKARQDISKVPNHHDLIPGRVFYGSCHANGQKLDFDIRVVPNTSNGQAINLMDRRCAEAKKDRENGIALGQYSNNLRHEQEAKTRVEVFTKVGGQNYRISMDVEGSSTYKVNGEYEMGLRNAVQGVMKKAHMQLARDMNAQRPTMSNDYQAPSSYRM